MNDLDSKLDAIIIKHQEIEKKLSNQDALETSKLIEYNKEYSDLLPIVELINSYKLK